jgi:glycosyltransferase involved in cell wall biosynthesis
MNLGLMRVKNEARWIDRAVRSLLPICDRVLVMDDNSTDGTPDICESIPDTIVLPSPFKDTNEARDKNWLLDAAGEMFPETPDWIVAIDGDEVLLPQAVSPLVNAMSNPAIKCISLRVLYLWNSEDIVRVDGVYGDFHRESIWRPRGARFNAPVGAVNFHCGNVPAAERQPRVVLTAPLAHYGYLHKADRCRKFEWYNRIDPGNATEDHYRHMVIGDVFPAESQFTHSGPLKLRSLHAVLGGSD